ncbi:isochorismatase family protein [Flavobacterium ustbae]|uniref:isochorismatase family protein n=1 Tax=Flavobacterium ustbae TaxID=2488790 RepID=UPI000F76D4CE|nr:isochorismatase family protein [Flavobacterium ustbae]
MEIKHSKETALLLLEIQNDYFFKGKMELHDSYDSAFNAKKALDFFRKKRKKIIHVQHVALNNNASHFIKGSYGAEIFEDVAPKPGEKIIVKNNHNAFNETTLLEYLTDNEINHLIIAGMMSNMNVDATVCTAKDLGFKIELIE